MMRVHEHRRATGMVYILALLTMTFVIVSGVAFLQVAETYASGPSVKLDRARAQAIAEGGLAVALQILDGDSTYTGTLGPTNLGNGSYRVVVTRAGSNIDVESRGTVGTTTSGVHARLEVPAATPGLWASSVLAAGDINLNNNSHVTVTDSDLRTAATLYVNPDNSTLTGVTEQNVSGFAPVVVDMASLSATADTTLAPDTVMPAGTYVGTFYCPGRLTLDAGVRIEGSLFVAGNLQLKPFGGDIAVVAPDGGLAIVVTGGQLTGNNIGSLQIDGHVVATSGFNLNRVTLDAVGGLVCGGNVAFTQTVGEWDHEDSVLEDPRAVHISGGPSGGAAATGPADELWRRPLRHGE